MKLLILGCGSIGTVIAEAAERLDEIEQIGLYDREYARTERLMKDLSKAEKVERIDFANSDVDLVIEAACQQAAKEYIPLALENDLDAMIMSVGAFADKDFQARCYSAVGNGKSNLLIPSGAIAGIDALKAAGRDRLEMVRHTVVKPPKGLKGVKYLEDEGIDVDQIEERSVLYSGPASEAVRHFPANVNVSATVSLAGIGFERTQVEVICDPAARFNSHQLHSKGEFGELQAITRNRPSPDNPRTSYLASLSAVSALTSYARRIWIGI